MFRYVIGSFIETFCDLLCSFIGLNYDLLYTWLNVWPKDSKLGARHGEANRLIGGQVK